MKRKLGDKINRGFSIVVIILGAAFLIRGTIGIINHNKCDDDFDASHFTIYPETQDDLGETANGLDVPRSIVDTTVDEAYVNGFFKD